MTGTQNKIAYLLRANNTRRGYLRTSTIGLDGSIVRWDSRDTQSPPTQEQLDQVSDRQARLGELLRMYDEATSPTTMVGAILAELIDRVNLTQVQERAFRRNVIATYVARLTSEGETVDYDDGGLQ